MAARRRYNECKDYIFRGAKILDLGCGSGILAETFQKLTEAEVVGADVIDRRVSPIPFALIDGKNLPFADKEFDATLIVFVLHHAEDPLALLREAKRVTKDKIIIYEDLLDGFFSKLLCRFHGFSYDNLFGNPADSSFKTEVGWKEVFNRLGLALRSEKRISAKWDPIKRKMFVLRVK